MSAAQKRELEGFRALSKISLELQAGGDRLLSSTIMLGMDCAHVGFCSPSQNEYSPKHHQYQFNKHQHRTSTNISTSNNIHAINPTTAPTASVSASKQHQQA
jgi:hypothetical protein